MQTNSIKEENEKKKKYLRQYKKHGRRIKCIEAEIEAIRSMRLYPSNEIDGMPHAHNNSDLSGYAAELTAKENELYQEGVEQVKQYKEISARIKEMDNEDERDVLILRYIAGMDWWKIAKEMDCSESWVYELHGNALKKLKIL